MAPAFTDVLFFGVQPCNLAFFIGEVFLYKETVVLELLAHIGLLSLTFKWQIQLPLRREIAQPWHHKYISIITWKKFLTPLRKQFSVTRQQSQLSAQQASEVAVKNGWLPLKREIACNSCKLATFRQNGIIFRHNDFPPKWDYFPP